MGIFDGVLDLFAGSPEKQVQRHGKRVRSKDAQQEDRQASIHWLADQGTPMAIYAMLGRYEMTYEHQMKDEGEKELVGELLLGLGETARDPLEKFIPQSKSFARPLAIYQQLFGEDAARTLTLAMLAEELKKSAFKITRKRSILLYLSFRT